MVREWWDSDLPKARALFAEIVEFAPPDVQLALDEARRATVSADMCLRMIDVLADRDVTEMLPQVHAPTLVLHPAGGEHRAAEERPNRGRRDT